MSLLRRAARWLEERRLLLPFDTYVRHRFAAELLGRDGENVLDVGGAGYLARFLPRPRIVELNRDSGDVHGSGTALPFLDGVFDTVVTLDTLEHVPRPSREQFLRELLRVARHRVLLACPLGTPQHARVERELLEEYQACGRDVPFLREHVVNGLPTLEELREHFSGVPCAFHFEGDFHRYARWSRRVEQLRGAGGRAVTRIPRWLFRLLIHLSVNLRYRSLAGRRLGPRTNRVYVLARSDAGRRPGPGRGDGAARQSPGGRTQAPRFGVPKGSRGGAREGGPRGATPLPIPTEDRCVLP